MASRTVPRIVASGYGSASAIQYAWPGAASDASASSAPCTRLPVNTIDRCCVPGATSGKVPRRSDKKNCVCRSGWNGP